MIDEIYTDPLGRKYHVLSGADFNRSFNVLGGLEYEDDASILIPISEPDSKLEFPSTPIFNDYFSAVASGTVVHEVTRERAYGPHIPEKIEATKDGLRVAGKEGFAATALNIFRKSIGTASVSASWKRMAGMDRKAALGSKS